LSGFYRQGVDWSTNYLVQRGVTRDQLTPELKKMGVRGVAPVEAQSESVAECCAARVVGKATAKFWDYPLTTLSIVLGNGHIHKTSTHGFNEEACDGRREEGPSLSNWLIGSGDILGVMSRASIIPWPVYERRACLVYAFEDPTELLRALREILPTEIGVE